MLPAPVRCRRFERSLSALTAASTPVTAAEICFEHDSASTRRWDTVTAEVVAARSAPPPDPQFFTDTERKCAAALLDQLTGQCDENQRVPVLQMIEASLAGGRDRRLALRGHARGRPGVAGHAGLPRR